MDTTINITPIKNNISINTLYTCICGTHITNVHNAIKYIIDLRNADILLFPFFIILFM